ncbi:hypothetical protein [Flavitalea sp.]|nr:hypothetical protein [Flavitalea sp.]
MSDELDDLKKLWQDSKSNNRDSSADILNTIVIARQQMKRAARLQLTGLFILIIIATGLWAFFSYVARFQQPISIIGAGLMLGGIILRIIIELFSIFLSVNIDLAEPAIKTNNASLTYIRFRKTVNGPITAIILILYTIGFYMLTPEFSLYFTIPVLILIDLSYLVAAIIFTWFIRNAVKKEMKILKQVLRITNDLRGTNDLS